ncbi:MAG: hypothetical protein IKG39_07415 [Lachnospiraceae bacterium]|nr:hypothetical protein [Lachnospiraceae bacterium]
MATQGPKYDDIERMFQGDSPEMKKVKKILSEMTEDESHCMMEYFFTEWSEETYVAARAAALIFSHWQEQHLDEDPGDELLPELGKAMNQLGMGVNLNVRKIQDPGNDEPNLEIKMEIPVEINDAVLDRIRDIMSDKTDLMVKYIFILGMEWAHKHPDEHIMDKIIFPVVNDLGDSLGFTTIQKTYHHSKKGTGSREESERILKAVDDTWEESNGKENAEE